MKSVTSVLLCALCTWSAAAQEPNTSGGLLVFAGVDDGSYPLQVTVLEPSFTMDVTGAPSLPFTLFTGGLVPGSAITAALQLVDVGTPPAYSDWVIVMDGLNPAGSFLNFFAFTDASGSASFTFPSGQPASASTVNIQGVIWDPAHPDTFDLTAATQLSLQPCTGTPLALGDDAFVQVVFSSWTFPFYGTSYTDAFIGSNGYVTFGAGDTGFIQSEINHQSGPPRIADFWDDLSPNLQGSVMFNDDLVGSATVCRLGVAHFAVAGPYALNTTRLGIDTFGNILIDWPNGLQSSIDPLVGISPGTNLSNAPIMVLSLGNGYLGAVNESIYEVFNNTTRPFNLGGRALSFTPMGSGDQYRLDVQ
ncbi:MAG: hypothetical protein CMJ83_10540 [Planctomycetes bacterium]|nr:hypothetical protein [Planctomycetota bacterium]